jgi:hypothetical protein
MKIKKGLIQEPMFPLSRSLLPTSREQWVGRKKRPLAKQPFLSSKYPFSTGKALTDRRLVALVEIFPSEGRVL